MSDIQLSDFRDILWDSVFAADDEPTCDSIWRPLKKAADNAEMEGKLHLANAYLLLSRLATMMLNAGLQDAPFTPMAILEDGRRGMIPEDLDENQLAILNELSTSIPNSDMRARVADVLWIRKRDIASAKLAIESYIESASIIEHSSWPAKFTDRLERALRLAMSISKGNSDYINKVVAAIEETIDRQCNQDWHLNLRCKNIIEDLSRLLLEFKIGDPKKHIAILEKLVSFCEGVPNSTMADKVLGLVAGWQILNGNEQGKTEALVRAADCLFGDAARCAAGDNPNKSRALSLRKRRLIGLGRRTYRSIK
ncbi:MAG: hypothetical protein HRF49_09380 [bacterium]